MVDEAENVMQICLTTKTLLTIYYRSQEAASGTERCLKPKRYLPIRKTKQRPEFFNERTLTLLKNIYHYKPNIVYFKTQTTQRFLFSQPRSYSGQLVLSAACCVFPQAGLFVSRVCSSISSPETLITCDC